MLQQVKKNWQSFLRNCLSPQNRYSNSQVYLHLELPEDVQHHYYKSLVDPFAWTSVVPRTPNSQDNIIIFYNLEEYGPVTVIILVRLKIFKFLFDV